MLRNQFDWHESNQVQRLGLKYVVTVLKEFQFIHFPSVDGARKSIN